MSPEPSADQPSADQPSADQPSADQPSADQPSADQEPPADEQQPADPPRNPFLVPGTEMNPGQPLVPWQNPQHELYYVAVDHTEAAYQEFLRRVNNDARTLRDHGRLVAVRGGQGCGKTSLLNRCIAWMRTELARHELQPIILDFSQVVPPDELLEKTERLSMICRLVVDQAVPRLGLDAAMIERLDHISAPLELYYYLSTVLNQIAERINAVLIILLPGTDLAKEIVDYAQMVRPRLVFCIESSGDSPARALTAARTASPAPPILLEVTSLKQDDASLFAERRLAMHHGETTTMPTVGEDVMSALERSPAAATIAGLADLLHGIYEYKLGQGRPYTAVSQGDVMNYLLSRFSRGDAS